MYCTSELAGEGYRPSSSFNSSVLPIPVATQTNAWVCGRWLAGIRGSNLAGLWMSLSLSRSLVSVVCCQVQIFATGRSLVQRSPTGCVFVLRSVIRCNNNPLQLQCMSRKVRLRKKGYNVYHNTHQYKANKLSSSFLK